MSMIAFLYLQNRRLEAAKRGKKQDRPAASAEPTRDTHRHHRVLQSWPLPTMSLQAQELATAARGQSTKVVLAVWMRNVLGKTDHLKGFGQDAGIERRIVTGISVGCGCAEALVHDHVG